MSAELEKRVMRKISFRIVPFIMLLYFIAFIDRVNIGFAALTMNKDLGFLAGGIRPRSRHFLPRLFSFRGAVQSDPRKGRCAALDRPGDDHVGDHFRGFRVYQRRDELPHLALFAGRGGGRLLSRHHSLSQLLVPGALSRRRRFAVHGGGADLGGSRFADFERLAGDGRLAWPQGLAVDVHHGGHPGVHPWLRCFGLPDRQAGKGEVAER